MILFEHTDVYGWEAAIRGMRNPKNSWAMSDSHHCDECTVNFRDCEMVMSGHTHAIECNNGALGFCIGENDMKLMQNLASSGSDHGKFLRMINVTVDITAPLYWWKEFDTYKVGTVANSCSTIHKIHSKEFVMDDFSTEHLIQMFDSEKEMARVVVSEGFKEYTLSASEILDLTIQALNCYRRLYLATKDKKYWWQMIQLLPSSYNQKRTVQLNYEVIRRMYNARKAHKLDEWREGFCGWVKELPYAKELIVGDEKSNEK